MNRFAIRSFDLSRKMNADFPRNPGLWVSINPWKTQRSNNSCNALEGPNRQGHRSRYPTHANRACRNDSSDRQDHAGSNRFEILSASVRLSIA